ncbi:ribonuclease HI [Candidatus Saccharibacteria bacterium]|nr:ribonuclease HI [Candidatus Saccharibacteria bacterium]
MRILYTDGSASPNPGPGGFAVIEKGWPVRIGSEDGETTNIRMEGLALINALEFLNGDKAEVKTDSEFWINVVTKWAPKWEAKGWAKKGGEIKNLDIVKKLYVLYQASNAKLVWLRGHNGHDGNELADTWANKARDGARL